MRVTALLLLIPIIGTIKADSCIPLEKCKALSWLSEVKPSDKYEEARKRFACSNQETNLIKCPTVTNEQLSAEEIANNALKRKKTNSTSDA